MTRTQKAVVGAVAALVALVLLSSLLRRSLVTDPSQPPVFGVAPSEPRRAGVEMLTSVDDFERELARDGDLPSFETSLVVTPVAPLDGVPYDATLTVHVIADGEASGRVVFAPAAVRERSAEEFGPGAMNVRREGLRRGRLRVFLHRALEGWSPTRANALTVDLVAGENHVDLGLERLARVFGSVRDVEGRPIDDAIVVLTRVDGARETVRATTKLGEYEASIASGDWHADLGTLVRNGSAPPPRRRFRITPGAEARVDLVCEHGSASLRGVVLDETSRPIANVSVVVERILDELEPSTGALTRVTSAAANSLHTDASGQFEFADLARAPHRVWIGEDSWAPFAMPEAATLGVPVIPLELDFAVEPNVDRIIRAVRALPVRVHGRVIVDSAGAISAASGSKLRVIVPNFGPTDDDVVRIVSCDTGGAFELWLDARCSGARVEVAIDGTSRSFPLATGGRIEDTGPRTLRFP